MSILSIFFQSFVSMCDTQLHFASCIHFHDGRIHSLAFRFRFPSLRVPPSPRWDRWWSLALRSPFCTVLQFCSADDSRLFHRPMLSLLLTCHLVVTSPFPRFVSSTFRLLPRVSASLFASCIALLVFGTLPLPYCFAPFVAVSSLPILASIP